MKTSPSPSGSSQPRHLQDRAAEDLRFIRATMERAASFTAVPGWGTVAIALTALAAAALAAQQPTQTRWLLVWLAEAALAVLIAAVSILLKARRLRVPLFRGSGARFLFGLGPPFIAAALLTLVLYRAGLFDLLPGLWLLLYGAGVVTGGAFSVRAVPTMGLCFMALGAAVLLLPTGGGPGGYADAAMAIGFGGLHLGFGAVIAWKHGG